MRAPILLVALVAAVTPVLGAAGDTVRIRSTAFALERLRELGDIAARSSPDVAIDWSGHGSASSITGILEGTDDVALFSRELDRTEKEILTRLSTELTEHVLALDALAVVVHPSNPIESVTVSQLRSILSRSLVGWHGVGGPNVDIRLVLPHRLSDDAWVLEQRLFGAADSPGRLTIAAEFLETGADIIERVRSDERALGIVSMSVGRDSVKTVPLVARDGEAAFSPTLESVEGADYPLGRALYLYVRKSVSEPVRRVVSTFLLSEGQSAVARAGFVPLPADRPVIRTLALATPTPRLSVAGVSFPVGTSRLGREARQVLDGIARVALRDGADVWVTGHSEPQEEPASQQPALSAERAESVAAYLRELGVAVSRAEGRGSAEGFPSIETRTGNRDPRRAELWILPRR